MITVERLFKNYGTFQALKGISFELKKGEILGFLGPNGAGKTTTMRILTTFLPYQIGSVKIDGNDVLEDPFSVRKLIGYLPETPPLYPELRVKEYLRFVGRLKGIRKNLENKVSNVIEHCGLGEKQNFLLGHLSKGYRQRAGLAQALIHEPKLLILDEPTSGLDPAQIVEIRDFIRSLGQNHSILLSSHILPEVNQLCDRVLIIDHGEIIASGNQAELSALVTAREKLIIRVDQPESAAKILSSWSPVLKNDIISLDGVFSDQQKAEIIRKLVDSGMGIFSFTSEQISLEEAFMEIIRRKINASGN